MKSQWSAPRGRFGAMDTSWIGPAITAASSISTEAIKASSASGGGKRKGGGGKRQQAPAPAPAPVPAQPPWGMIAAGVGVLALAFVALQPPRPPEVRDAQRR